MPETGNDELAEPPVTPEGTERTESGVVSSSDSVPPNSPEEKLIKVLSITRHELSNVLTLAGAILYRMEMGIENNIPEASRHLRRLNDMGIRVVDRMLSFAKIDSLELYPTDMSIVLRKEVDELRFFYGEKIQIGLDVPDKGVYIDADYNCVSEILTNLVKNAVESMKQCPERPKIIKITLEEKGDDVFISICDNGAGFPQSILERDGNIWSSTKTGDGHGIGLNICQTIMRLMKGVFQVSNNPAPEHGATVTMVFKNLCSSDGDSKSVYSV